MAVQAGFAADRRLGLFEARAKVYEVLGEFEPSRADYDTALALADEAGDRAAQSRLLAALGLLWGGHKDYQRGLELTRRAAEVAETAGDQHALAAAGICIGVIRLNLGQTIESRRVLERSLGLFQELQDQPGQARTLDVLAMATLCAGDLDRSVAYSRAAIPRLQDLGDRWTETSSRITLALALAYRGERAEAEASFQHASTVCEEMGARSAIAYAKSSYAEGIEQFGPYELTMREASAALRIGRELGHLEGIATGLRSVGRVHRLCGDVDGARRLHEEMLAAARELGAGLLIAEALSELGRDAAQAGEVERATELLAEAVATAPEAPKVIVRALLTQCELALQVDRPADALAAVQRLRDAASQFRVIMAEGRRVEGEALAALGRPDEALAALRQAKSEALATGAEPTRWRACLALGTLLQQSGSAEQAREELAEARRCLERVAESLSDQDLRQAFTTSETMRRAREAS
jgi:tetratricopeptide (TPR) repeat protein